MSGRRDSFRITAVIPTRDRADLLAGALESLAGQTLDPGELQVVVVDDGSRDATPELCAARTADDPAFTYLRMTSGGLSQAKNIGLLAARAPIIVFLDDDDVFDSDLLAAHLDAHAAHPEPHAAVLGYTTWHASLALTPLMRYVTEIGQLLFSYPGLTPGAMLDYTRFWGGRSSCKRDFLLAHGLFDCRFTSIIEDIELAYRLSRFGFKVVYEPSAVSYAARAYSFDEFCRRCERRGRALALFHRRHPTAEVAAYCGIETAEERWEELGPRLAALTERAGTLEQTVAVDDGDAAARDALHGVYAEVFEGFQVRGLVAELARERG